MNRKQKNILIILTVLLVILAAVVIGGWKMGWLKDLFTKRQQIEFSQAVLIRDEEAGQNTGELMAVTETKEEAEKIAELYGIKLESFEEGVAVYSTTEPVWDVISRGKELGYPELSLNYVRKMIQ